MAATADTTLIRHNRRDYYFADHALERWLQRRPGLVRESCDLIPLLQDALAAGRRTAVSPRYARLSAWHHARTDHYLLVEGGAFPVKRDERRRLLVTTFLVDGPYDHN